MQVPDGVVAPLRIAGIRERVSIQASQPSLINHDVDVLDEISRRRSAMAPDPIEVARLNRFDDRPEIGRSKVVDTFRVDDGSIGEDLKKHAKLAAVVGTAQGKPRQQRDRRS